MKQPDYNNITPAEAIALQQELRARTQIVPLTRKIEFVGGADISFNKYSNVVYAGIVVLSFPELRVIENATTVTKTSFPYVPGLLAFREVPAVMEVWDKLEIKPDVLVLDGHGIAHPRRMGIATHFSLMANTPAIGCAKSLLVGTYEMPENVRFATSELFHKNEKIGEVLRTKLNCNPVFISPGHLITMQESMTIIKQCSGKYRIPEPTRLAHLLVNQLRVQYRE